MMSDRVRFVERNGPLGFFFLLAFIGAAVYFITVSDQSFLGVIVALLKAIVWPAFATFHALDALGV